MMGEGSSSFQIVVYEMMDSSFLPRSAVSSFHLTGPIRH